MDSSGNRTTPGHDGGIRFSSAAYPERERAEACREFFGRTIVGVEFEPVGGRPLCIHSTIRCLDDLQISFHSSSGMAMSLPPEMIRDDNVVLTSTNLAAWQSSQFSREVLLGRDDAVLSSNCDPGWQIQPEPLRGIAVCMPRAAIFPRIAKPDAALGRRLPGQSSALRLLVRYLNAFREISPLTPGLAKVARNHILDLTAVALGATSDAAEIARERGMRAALLRDIKTDIETLLDESELTVECIAMRHRLTIRYVQRLFEAEGSSFTEFVRELRLTRAYQMLKSPRTFGWKISAIAFAAGFNDLSYFNRAFRRRFGMAPSDVREQFGAWN